MLINDHILDLLNRLRNGSRVNKKTVEIVNNKLVINVLEKLKQYGFIKEYENKGNTSDVQLAYDKFGRSKIHDAKKISLLGRRIYKSYKELTPVFGGRGMYLLSTSKGVLAGDEAIKAKQGGELIFKIW